MKIITRINSNQLSACFSAGLYRFDYGTEKIWAGSVWRIVNETWFICSCNSVRIEGYSKIYSGELFTFGVFEHSIKFDEEVQFNTGMMDHTDPRMREDIEIE